MAMRKVYYGPEGIMLSHILRMYDKESLSIYARELQLRRISGLKKDELAEKIANELLEPTVMKRRVATFSMTIWHVQKLYTSDGNSYQVLPYDFFTAIKNMLKMKNGLRQMIKFMVDSRWTEKTACKLCKKKNSQIV